VTWTSAFGRGCGVLLDAIVGWLALTRINPNVLTALGLVINVIAAFLFGYATAETQRRMFFYAGLVIIGSGFFDLVDGRVAPRAIKSPHAALDPRAYSDRITVYGSRPPCFYRARATRPSTRSKNPDPMITSPA